jgi:integrase
VAGTQRVTGDRDAVEAGSVGPLDAPANFHVRVHDLRHAHASWLLAGGSDLKAVMDRLGHAQVTTTQKYLHPHPDADHKNLDALKRIRGRQVQEPDEPDASLGGAG